MGELREPLSELLKCGLPQALEVMGERWSFMILRASFNGLHHFEEFLSELGIARNILSNRLAKLVEHGILKREPCADDRRKIVPSLKKTRFWSMSVTGCRSARSRSWRMTAGFSRMRIYG